MFLAEVYIYTGRAEEAEPIIRNAIDILETTHPDGHTSIHSSNMRLAGCLIVLGQVEVGERHMMEHLEAVTELWQGTPTVGRARQWTANFYERIGMPERATSYRD
jgi:hypothetical protein